MCIACEMEGVSRRSFLRHGAMGAFAMLAAGAFSLSSRRAFAAEDDSALTLTGAMTQGSLIIGRTLPGAKVRFDGKALSVQADGQFAFGFGRDFGASAVIDADLPDGRKLSRTLSVAPREYDIQRIDGLPDSMVSPPQDVLDRIARENKAVGAARSFDTPQSWFAEKIDWPVTGIISGVYGSQRILNGEPRRPHFGVDIASPEGTPIAAPAPGIVRMAEPDLYYTGGTVILDHGAGISTTYLHMSRLDVAVGDQVSRGASLGLVGKTGRATGPHLCWRLNWFQERLDAQLAAGPMPG